MFAGKAKNAYYKQLTKRSLPIFMNEDALFLPLIADDDDKSCAFKNRIRKRYRHIRKWANRTKTNCFRIYDRDIKEWPLVIDYYAGRFCVQYFTFDRENDEASPEVVEKVNGALNAMFKVSSDLIYWRSRVRRKKFEQYEKKGEEKEFFTALEYGVKFKINLIDYLDTGLFLDHRETRHHIASISKDKSVLNLFAYTCSFSVHAALAGASFTKSVDLSNTYCDWGRDNFELNHLPENTNLITRADCLIFLTEEVASKATYDIIIIDPPTISRSKKMTGMFDIQKDYPFILTKALKLLSPGGIIFFSTNFRKFHMDPSLLPECNIQDITDKTIPMDFHQNKIHYCWKITNQK